MKKIKGFTLVELIIVMAIMALLMSAIMNMFKPIRSVFVDSTYYEAQRTSQSGIVSYIADNVRFALNISVVSGGTPEAAVEHFTNMTGDNSPLKKTGCDTYGIEVIAIDNNTADAEFYHGRLRRYEVYVDDSGSVKYINKERMALGSAFYGRHTYSIAIDPDPSDVSFSITASSILAKNTDEEMAAQTNTTAGTYDVVSTDALIFMRNQDGSKFDGIFDVSAYNGNSTTPGSVTYIVYQLHHSYVGP